MNFPTFSGIRRCFGNNRNFDAKIFRQIASSGVLVFAAVSVMSTSLLAEPAACPVMTESSEMLSSCCAAKAAPVMAPSESTPETRAETGPQAQAFVFVDAQGNPTVPTETQLTAINTLLMQLDAPMSVLRPVEEVAKSENAAAGDAVMLAVDAEGNLNAPTAAQATELTEAQDRRRANAVSEPINAADPSQGYRQLANESFSIGWLDQYGNLQFECVMGSLDAGSTAAPQVTESGMDVPEKNESEVQQ